MAEAANVDIPGYLLEDPVAPEMLWEIGSLGSPVLALRGGHPDILERMADLYADRFRKGWRDLVRGIAVFMAPSRAHELTTQEAQELVSSLCAARGIAVVALRMSTIEADGGRRRKGEPDESFFVGAKAERYRSLLREGGPAFANEALADEPADLAVEVEHTRHDSSKRDIYRRAGVRELWEFATSFAGKDTAIIDLRARGGPRGVEVSKVVPGVRADCLDGALQVLREIGGLVEFSHAGGRGEPVAERLLAAAGVAGSDEP